MDCTAVSEKFPVQRIISGYYPSFGGNTFLATWFAMLFMPNLYFSICCKAWTYMLVLCLGCITKSVGYAGRIVLHSKPFLETGFQMQICCLIFGPAFNSAAIYLTLKHTTLVFGPKYSIVRLSWCTYIFIGANPSALVLQAIGSDVAAAAGDDLHQQNTGTDIMIAGKLLASSWQTLLMGAFGFLQEPEQGFDFCRNSTDSNYIDPSQRA